MTADCGKDNADHGEATVEGVGTLDNKTTAAANATATVTPSRKSEGRRIGIAGALMTRKLWR